jgi:hypothetical protein
LKAINIIQKLKYDNWSPLSSMRAKAEEVAYIEFWIYVLLNLHLDLLKKKKKDP